MATLLTATKFALLVLCGAGFYFTWFLLMNNGSVELMTSIRESRILPGTTQPLKTTYTKFAAVDYQLTILDLFFWEQVDGSRPDASLFCFHFAGQVLAGWPLLMIEGLRKGNSWKIVSFIAIWGLMVQTLAYAVIIPIYLIIHLSMSPTVVPNHVSDFTIDQPDIVSIPLSMFVGYLLPTILMSMPAPSILGFGQKQTLMAIWQAFPLWVAIIRQILHLSILGFADVTKRSLSSRVSSQSCSMSAMRKLYIGLLMIAGVTQISTTTLIAVSKWFPDLFAPKYAGVFNASNVFLPAAFSASTKMPSIGSGALLLLQFDEYIGSTSLALWASFLYLQAYEERGGLRAFARQTAWGVGLFTLSGPLGYAIACIWARDEIVWAKVEERNKKSQ